MPEMTAKGQTVTHAPEIVMSRQTDNSITYTGQGKTELSNFKAAQHSDCSIQEFKRYYKVELISTKRPCPTN